MREAEKGAVAIAALRTCACAVGLGATLFGLHASVGAQEAVFPLLRDEAPAGTGVLEACDPGVPGTARCGVYRVWENRDARRGRTVDVHFVVLGALDPAERQDDAVTVFGGGPGADMIGGVAGLTRVAEPFRRSRDIVLFDFRGTGRSGSLTCDVPYPGGLPSRFGTVFPTDHAEACRDALLRRADLAWYHTNATVDDLEEIRSWLGYSAFNLIAGSYGTREAQVYMRRYPGSVRTAVLNGLVPVGRPGYLYMAPSLQGALEAVFADCREDRACAGAYPHLEARFQEVIERLDRGPVTVEVRGERVPFSRGDFAYALRGLLYGRSGEVPYRIDQAWRGEWSELATYYVGRTDWVSDGFASGYHFSTLCTEDLSRVTPGRIDEVSAGTFMAGHLIRGYYEVCRIWPAAPLPKGFDEPVRSSVPTLLLSGTRDPVTPAEFAEEVAAQLPNSVHVVVEGGGHGVGGPCVLGMQLTLVETGSVEGLDASCVEGVRGPPFRLPDGDSGGR